MPQRRRGLEISLLGELLSHLVTEVVIHPGSPTVNRALLIVELRIKQHETVNLVRPLAAKIEAQARYADLTEPGRKAREETAFLTGDATAMHHDNTPFVRHFRPDERCGQMQDIERTERYGAARDGHTYSLPVGGTSAPLRR